MDKGWIKVYRKIAESVIWSKKPYPDIQAWLDLMLLTNHSEGLITVKNGERLIINRGECGYSKKALADRWGWSEGKVRRYILFLESQKMVRQKTVENHTVTAINNYSKYNDGGTNGGQIDGQIDGQTATNKNDKNEKNEKKVFLNPSKNSKNPQERDAYWLKEFYKDCPTLGKKQ